MFGNCVAVRGPHKSIRDSGGGDVWGAVGVGYVDAELHRRRLILRAVQNQFESVLTSAESVRVPVKRVIPPSGGGNVPLGAGTPSLTTDVTDPLLSNVVGPAVPQLPGRGPVAISVTSAPLSVVFTGEFVTLKSSSTVNVAETMLPCTAFAGAESKNPAGA